MKILLLCSAGMSTSLLVAKMEKAAAARDIDIVIYSHAANEGKKMVGKADIVLLGPQVRFMKGEFEKLTDVPVQVIDMRAYGLVDGERVLEDAVKALGTDTG